MDTLQRRFIWIVCTSSVAFVANLQNNEILVIITELSNFVVKLNAIDSFVAFSPIFVHYDFRHVGNAIVW